jgi:hypothetical protein
MDGISILWRPNSIYSDQTCRSSVGGYCDHQENRKSVTGREHLRVPSGVPLPASGLSAASELSLESTQRGTTASQRAERSEWTACQPAG